MILLLAFLCLFLALQNHRLKGILNSRLAKPALVEIGAVVPAIVFATLDGKRDSLDYRDSKYSCWVVAFLRPDCPVCRKALPLWEEIKATLSPKTGMAAFSMTGGPELNALLTEEAVTLPVGIILESETFSKAYKVPGVPMTLVIESGGEVFGAWLGLPEGRNRTEIREALAACTSLD